MYSALQLLVTQVGLLSVGAPNGAVRPNDELFFMTLN